MSQQNSPNHPMNPQKDLSLSASSQKAIPLKQKKDEYLKNIRSQKRKHHLQKKRMSVATDLHKQEDIFGQEVPFEKFIDICLLQTYTFEQLSQLVTSLYSPDRRRQHFGLIGICKLLSETGTSLIQPIMETGILPQLIKFLGIEGELQLQLEAALALVGLASGTTEQAKEVIDNGAIPGLIQLLGSQSSEVRVQAARVLRNIAADNTSFRDMVLQGGAVGPLIKMMEEALAEGEMELVKEGNRTLSCMCRGKPVPPYEEIKESLLIFAKVIMSQEDVEMLTKALWPLVFLSDESEERIQPILDPGVVPSLVKLLVHPEGGINSKCIRILGNLFKGQAEQVDGLLVMQGILERIFYVLRHPQAIIRVNAAWALANLAAGMPKHKDYIVLNANYLDQILFVQMNDMLEVRQEITWVINNILSDPTPEQWKALFEKNIFRHLEKLVEDDEDDLIVEVGLRGIKVILDLESPEGKFYLEKLFQNEKTVVAAIEKLKSGKSPGIAGLARQILAKWKSTNKELTDDDEIFA